MIYAVDFDGTIVTNNFPQIGKLFPYSLEVLRELQNQGNEIILWTCRTGTDLQIAVDFLKENNFIPDTINDHSKKMKDLFPDSRPPKVFADFYIDDHCYSFIENKMTMNELWFNFAKKLKIVG